MVQHKLAGHIASTMRFLQPPIKKALEEMEKRKLLSTHYQQFCRNSDYPSDSQDKLIFHTYFVFWQVRAFSEIGFFAVNDWQHWPINHMSIIVCVVTHFYLGSEWAMQHMANKFKFELLDDSLLLLIFLEMTVGQRKAYNDIGRIVTSIGLKIVDIFVARIWKKFEGRCRE
uniref:Uncharacterized protein n=1 Tax=Romanomermis culicivorax TaxID=13658 RepID=A0A915KMS9_ROMCU